MNSKLALTLADSEFACVVPISPSVSPVNLLSNKLMPLYHVVSKSQDFVSHVKQLLDYVSDVLKAKDPNSLIVVVLGGGGDLQV